MESTRLCLPLCASVSPWAGERGAWETPRPSWWLGALDQGCCVWGDRKGGGGAHKEGHICTGGVCVYAFRGICTD